MVLVLNMYMKKQSVYGIAAAVLVISLITSAALYTRALNYRTDIASGVFDYAKRLHLADDEHPLHYEGGLHPFYEKSSSSDYDTYKLYQRGSVVSALLGLSLALALIYYASRMPDSKEVRD